MSYNTVQDVFDKAIHWIDAQNESNGSTNTVDTKEYAFRTPNILNMFLNVVYPASDTYQTREDRRPYLEPVSEMTDELDLDAYICMSVLPYALAAGLLQEENPDVADTAMQLYEENLLEAKNRLSAEDGEVENAYGGIEFGRFGRW